MRISVILSELLILLCLAGFAAVKGWICLRGARKSIPFHLLFCVCGAACALLLNDFPYSSLTPGSVGVTARRILVVMMLVCLAVAGFVIYKVVLKDFSIFSLLFPALGMVFMCQYCRAELSWMGTDPLPLNVLLLFGLLHFFAGYFCLAFGLLLSRAVHPRSTHTV